MPVFAAGAMLSPSAAAAEAFKARGNGITISDTDAGTQSKVARGPAGTSPGGSMASGNRYEIHLHAAPGMNEAKLMEMLERKLDEIRRRDGSNDRARFADRDEF